MEKIKNHNQYNGIIDYTLLDESATDADIINLCEKANILKVKSVCVYPKYVSLCRKELAQSDVLVCTVISFPDGTNSTEQKISETNNAILDGADEIDMVLNYKLLGDFSNDDRYDYLHNEVKSLSDICHSNLNKNGDKIILKVIVESGLLSELATRKVTHICIFGDADFIKTSTGKIKGPGAELDKVKIMYNWINCSKKQMFIKASGGIRTLEQMNMFLPYVDRFGMSYNSVDELNDI